MQTLDDLPLLDSVRAPTRKLSQADREWQADWQRSQALRWAGIEMGLRTGLRHYSLMAVQRMWFEEQAKLQEARR
jgi:hypothetical protein